MSGPKTSVYTLTAEQRRALEKQQELERRKALAKEKIKRNSDKLHQIGKMFSSDKEWASQLQSRTGSDGGFSQKLDNLQGLIESLAPLTEKANSDDLLSLEKAAKDMEGPMAQLEKQVAELKALSVKNENLLRTNLNAAIAQGYSFSLADIETADVAVAAAPSSEVAKEKLRTQLVQMMGNASLPAPYIAELESALKRLEEISDKGYLRNHTAIIIAPLLRKCEGYLADYAKYYQEFEAVYTEYLALCGLNQLDPQEYFCCAQAIDELKGEISRIKKAEAENVEKAYISECLDEIMVEMGYSVLGSREGMIRNVKRFRSELYSCGDGAAVNVTYSSDGKISMELGGIDEKDRYPDEHEAAQLCGAMEDFCRDFDDIRKRLKDKGVLLAVESDLPAIAENAQIINVKDYEIKADIERLQEEASGSRGSHTEGASRSASRRSERQNHRHQKL